VQEAVSPEANIIYGTTIDDTLGDEVRITVIAAGFDGGFPKARKAPRTVFAEVEESMPVVAPVAAPIVESISFFDTPALETEAQPLPMSVQSYSMDYVEDLEIEIDQSPSLPKRPQTADGTFGDDLDIPEFLRG
jgi:cell division protein FtsZ